MPSRPAANSRGKADGAFVIGLTGLIGSGKSTVAALLAEQGAVVIDADRVGREVVDQSPVLRRKLAATFGRHILRSDGSLNRDALAKEAFGSRRRKEQLDAIVHPALLTRLRKLVSGAGGTQDVVVIDAALLLNWGMGKECDLVVVVHARGPVRQKRMKKRGISAADFKARQRRQFRYGEFLQESDALILNSGTATALRVKVRRLWERVIAPAIDSRSSVR